MTLTQWLRPMFGSRGQVARASRRGKSRQASRLRSVPRLMCLEDRLALAVFTVTGMADGTLANLAGNGTLDLREAIELASNLDKPVDGYTNTDPGLTTIRF